MNNSEVLRSRALPSPDATCVDVVRANRTRIASNRDLETAYNCDNYLDAHRRNNLLKEIVRVTMARVQLELTDGHATARMWIYRVVVLDLPSSAFQRCVNTLAGGFFGSVVSGQLGSKFNRFLVCWVFAP